MPILTTLSNKLTTPGFKKSPILIKVYTGTDFSYVHSTWTFSAGSISLRSSTLPYHSYGNEKELTTATNQSANKTWPLRGGAVNSTSNIYTYNLNRIVVDRTFTSTVVATTVTSITTITETAIIFQTSSTVGLTTGTAISFAENFDSLKFGEIYYVRDLTTNTFAVSATTSSRAIVLVSTGSITATAIGIPRASTNIGYWINGVNIFNPSSDREVPNGYLVFPNLSYVAAYERTRNFNYDFNQDLAGGRVIANGAYTYHNFSFADAWTTGTAHIGTLSNVVATGLAEISVIPYLNNSLTNYDGHSKILGWSLDGYPIYGPYGYNQAMDCNSGIRPMTSGYSVFASAEDVNARVVDGALDTNAYPLGIFVQDYYYAGLGDLDVANGRFCVTPEYPEGTYAYFCSLESVSLKPSYPYVIGNTFKSVPVGSGQAVSSLTNGGGSAPKQTN